MYKNEYLSSILIISHLYILDIHQKNSAFDWAAVHNFGSLTFIHHQQFGWYSKLLQKNEKITVFPHILLLLNDLQYPHDSEKVQFTTMSDWVLPTSIFWGSKYLIYHREYHRNKVGLYFILKWHSTICTQNRSTPFNNFQWHQRCSRSGKISRPDRPHCPDWWLSHRPVDPHLNPGMALPS